MTETQRRINEAITSYKCALMNDTKWREVLSLVGKHKIPVQFSFVREKCFRSPIKRFPEDGTEGNHTKDCSIHGPFYLKEIYAIQCPKFEKKHDPKTGKRYSDDTRYTEFMEALRSLGQLPLTENEMGVIISGYQK